MSRSAVPFDSLSARCDIAELTTRGSLRWRPGLGAACHSEIFASACEASGAGAALALALDDWRHSGRSETEDRRAVLWVQTREAARLMIPRKSGRIIAIGSLSSFVGLHEVAAYVASKSAVAGLTRALAARVLQVDAIDVSAQMLELAREHNPDLDNVTWIHGDGESLHAIPEGERDVCFSHVVFQHIPDPAITLGYVREMGRVLAPGGWAAFQISNAPEIHHPRGVRERLGVWWRAVRRRGPRGQTHPAWRGSSVDLDALRGRRALDEGGAAYGAEQGVGQRELGQGPTVLQARGPGDGAGHVTRFDVQEQPAPDGDRRGAERRRGRRLRPGFEDQLEPQRTSEPAGRTACPRRARGHRR